MKAITTLIIALICTFSFAQINIETKFDESVYEVREKGNKALFKRLSKGKIGSIQFLKKGDFPKELAKEGLSCLISASIIFEGQEIVFTTDKLEKILFPGPIFFPGPILFPGPIFDELQEGNYEVIFNIEVTNSEFKEMLRRRPSRIPVTFKID